MNACSATQKSSTDSQKDKLSQSEFVLDELTIGLIEESINSEEIRDFFHFELKERLPLTMVYQQKSDDKDVTISCFGHPVKIAKFDNDRNGSIIELVKGVRNENEMTLVFKYPIEGITITAKFSKENQEWEKNDVIVVEN